jgi:DNA-binding SARP family transcriptional activator/tetratricopeptide (TPR) repeat protein
VGAIARVEFAVLGAVQVSVEGEPIAPGTRKEHLLLALLLVHVNRTVTVDQMVEALWGDEAPSKPAASIRAYISNIRRSLAVGDDDPKSVLATEAGGYRLAVARDRVDACRFEDEVGGIIAGATELDPASQAARLDAALAEVSGEPYADFVYEDFVEVEAARLGELVLAAREHRCELAILLGDAAAWLPTISALAAMHPLRERLRAAHMRALVDTGRHGEALRTFADHRVRMIEEMGVEPGPELRALELEILALDDLTATPSALADDEAGGQRHDPGSDGVEGVVAGPSERRQITTVAIVRRSAGTAAADPEDVGEVVADARRRWETIVEAHGATAEEIPDGLLAHVGYPTARERDVERAVRAALAVVAHDTDCVAGVATGPVLVAPGREGVTFTGDTSAIAMRLAFTGPTGSVVVAERTRELADRHIRFEVVDGLTTAAGIEIASADTPVPDLVGREEELALARRLVAECLEGHGRVLVVTGDAGIGKTAFVDRLAADFGKRVLRFVGSPFHCDTALWPVVASMEDHPDLSVPAVLAEWSQWGEDALVEVAPDPVERRSVLLGAAVDVVLDHVGGGPTMCVFDDVHAMDASSLEFVDALIEEARSAALLVVIAIRGGDEMGFADAAHASTVGLGPLAGNAARALVRSRAGRALEDRTESQIIERAGGVPLFVEELTRTLSTTSDADSANEVHPAVPDSLHELLMARLDAVPQARATTHLAAVAGDGFSESLLASVADRDPSEVRADLALLCDAGVLVRVRQGRDRGFRFRHGLILEAAYESVPRARRAQLHERFATALLAQHPELADTDSEVLARHHEAAGDLPAALRAWLRAAERSLAVWALAEASEAIRRGLAVADRLDEAELEDLSEIVSDLWLAHGVVLTQQAGPGSSEAAAAFDHVLTERGESLTSDQRFRALWGRWYAINIGGSSEESLAVAAQVHHAAAESGDTALLIEGHHVMWASLLVAGEFERALEHAREARSLYERETHHWLTYSFGGHDPGVCMHSAAGVASWILGEPGLGRADLTAAIRLADEIGHPYSRLEASFGPVAVAVLDRDVALLRTEADVLEQLADGGGLPVTVRGYIDGCRGLAAVAEGDVTVGLALLEEAADDWADLWGGYCLAFDTELALALAARGRSEAALAHIDSILASSLRGRWWDSEIYRVRGEVLAGLGQAEAAGVDLRRAVDIARTQKAIAFTSRAEASLATHLESR